MRKLILAAAAFAAIATPASAGYYRGYKAYYAPRVICHFVQVPVYGYYGVHYVAKKVCRTVY